jgi:translation initiation factor 1
MYAGDMRPKTGRLVYSTRDGDMRRTSQAAQPVRSLPPRQQTARISLDKSHRRGKVVTVVADLVLVEADLDALGRSLKTLCGAGGTVKDGRIEVQGDHRDTIIAHLTALGYKVKRVGG